MSAAVASPPSTSQRWPRGNAGPGRHSTASAIRIGYSATQSNAWGAIKPAAMPPISPPADIQR